MISHFLRRGFSLNAVSFVLGLRTNGILLRILPHQKPISERCLRLNFIKTDFINFDANTFNGYLLFAFKYRVLEKTTRRKAGNFFDRTQIIKPKLGKLFLLAIIFPENIFQPYKVFQDTN